MYITNNPKGIVIFALLLKHLNDQIKETVYLIVVNIQDRLIVVVYHKEDWVQTHKRVIVLVLWGLTLLLFQETVVSRWKGYSTTPVSFLDNTIPSPTNFIQRQSCSPTNWRESFQVRLAWILCLEICCQLWEEGLVWLQRDFFPPFCFVFWKQCVIIMTSWLLISPLLPEVKTSLFIITVHCAHAHTDVLYC